ncbi:hypothetical protein A3A63_01990 [Candidatus Gottesmanbacteria bacterium RIFCSPLOWO2_01_FULL_46_9]|uniref:nicotinate phosphoribosyltransferase n=1 Tax=Candidatus Gottesmanbacteria bacterium RIFCSPLOWO2_01_FULL_46_9 TaxID=1798394 RepID=A0A1F6B1F9_9BACT|nr:MAG: hypothetical protein A3A63_01990 [Candidatus Gottesmanbacteria bacterium RIFCSPLOWO2_01_FULL_46_9]
MKYWDFQTLQKIRNGFYSAVYFNRAREILLKEGNLTNVTIQVFQRNEKSILCGVEETIVLLKEASGCWMDKRWVSEWKELAVLALKDGDKISVQEPVLHIEGPYAYIAHLESLYLGILARRTLVATNVHAAVEAAGSKKVMFFADRFDYFQNQEGDGFAAHIGGASGVCTPAHVSRWDGKPVGTIPHALIAVHDGSTVESAKKFAKYFPNVPLIVLVDYDNDCVRTAIAVASALKGKIWGVRIDTGSDMTDVSLQGSMQRGVTPQLVVNVRRALNQSHYDRVKIIVSGGFNPEKIKLFENQKTPVDIYGVGSALLKGGNDFTADIVRVNGKKQAKIGRSYRPNNRMRVTV